MPCSAVQKEGGGWVELKNFLGTVPKAAAVVGGKFDDRQRVYQVFSRQRTKRGDMWMT